MVDNRMQGGARKNIRVFQKLVGERSLRRITLRLATTLWDLVNHADGDAREAELKADFWKEMSELGMKIHRLDADGR